MPQPITHIAVIRMSALGDVAMTVPVIRALVGQHPGLKITFVSRPFFKPLLEGIPNVDFFAVDLKGRHKGLFGIYRLYTDLKKHNINAVADLHDVLRSKILRRWFALNGKQVAFTDKGRAEKKALTRAENKIFRPLKPMFERHAGTFAQLGFAVDLAQPVFPGKAVLSPEILKVTGEKASHNWIGIAPFAQHQGKVYPKDLMQTVINQLASDNMNCIFLFGSKEEISLLAGLAQNHQNIIVIPGKISFEQELQLISNLNVMLSMDSGNAHIAAMLGIKTVTLWGATHPYAGFAPFGQPDENAMVSDREQYPLLPTSVYGNKKVAGYGDVMRTIEPEVVVQKINKILERQASRIKSQDQT